MLWEVAGDVAGKRVCPVEKLLNRILLVYPSPFSSRCNSSCFRDSRGWYKLRFAHPSPSYCWSSPCKWNKIYPEFHIMSVPTISQSVTHKRHMRLFWSFIRRNRCTLSPHICQCLHRPYQSHLKFSNASCSLSSVLTSQSPPLEV